MEQIVPHTPQKKPTLPTPRSQASSLHPCETIPICCWSHSVSVLCYAALENGYTLYPSLGICNCSSGLRTSRKKSVEVMWGKQKSIVIPASFSILCSLDPPEKGRDILWVLFMLSVCTHSWNLASQPSCLYSLHFRPKKKKCFSCPFCLLSNCYSEDENVFFDLRKCGLSVKIDTISFVVDLFFWCFEHLYLPGGMHSLVHSRCLFMSGSISCLLELPG